jgi:hypothetical protein
LIEQHHIVTYLDALQTKLDLLKKVQADTAAELDALLPSVFDQGLILESLQTLSLDVSEEIDAYQNKYSTQQ